MGNAKDIAAYYNSTLIHYKQWWDLSESQSLHYGIWNNQTKNFRQALSNTNKELMDLAEISEGDRVLDAGCGVGGAAIFLCNQRNAKVTGITLSQKQLDFANDLIKDKAYRNFLDFHLMDYTKTSFKNESFDVVWACESVSSAQDKSLFLEEAYRLLKKGGRLILSDYFLSSENSGMPNNLISKWESSWALGSLCTLNGFEDRIKKAGFRKHTAFDYTNHIGRSAQRMYYAALLARIPSQVYKLWNPKVSKYARNHYKSGIYQYRALKAGLWKYQIVLSIK